ncbi:MAG TPA: asparagine synthase B [Deltaproteobacteria bacterium]|nr:asparagine synthase B [Deltaproteobacteria bacterium]HPR54502.1 asparagine synthase B [Deltaproteobacteria bacterium]HXK46610.1 asparagine synthase B [Deltaproteobacteria bacterium]
MCSILGIFDIRTDLKELRSRALEMTRTMRHRGPDWSGIYVNDRAVLAHERLSIVDVNKGAQPLYTADGKVALAVNGEIYNHKDLKKTLKEPHQFLTESDCEIILALYRQRGADFLEDLNGIFAFALYDSEKDVYLIGRDHIGICPLYTGRDEHGNFYVASEMKALMGVCNQVEEFPPGHLLLSTEGAPRRYYERDWMEYGAVEGASSSIRDLRRALEEAVERQLMSDVPYGVLLSGGLDSSIISAVAKKYSAKRVETGGLKDAWWPQLHSFAIGLEGSPDLTAAQKVADYIGSIHHNFTFTVQEGLDAVRDVIYHIETYDVTTIRASTPMYLMARKIKSMGVKMVLSGEGADEIFGGYLYFHKAPDAREFHDETVRKLSMLSKYDCLRANKSLAAWGVEGRVPFLDKEFMDTAMRLNPSDKMCTGGRMEKHILRQAFEDYLPSEVAWRQKEQFSDGVGYSWIDTLRDMASHEVSDLQMENARYRFPINTPVTKEAYYYRSIFQEFFPLDSAARCVPEGPSVACSTPTAIKWDEAFARMPDPSGRAVKDIHKDSYK